MLDCPVGVMRCPELTGGLVLMLEGPWLVGAGGVCADAVAAAPTAPTAAITVAVAIVPAVVVSEVRSHGVLLCWWPLVRRFMSRSAGWSNSQHFS